MEAIPARLARHALERGGDEAIRLVRGPTTTVLSWDDLLRDAVGYGRWLTELGVVAGTELPMCLGHGRAAYGAFLGAMTIGAIPSFVAVPSDRQDPNVYWPAQAALLERIQGAVILADPAVAGPLAEAAPRSRVVADRRLPTPTEPTEQLAASLLVRSADDTALLQHSSGTTGAKKGVALRFGQIAIHNKALADGLGIGTSSRIASWLPLYHDLGLIAAFLLPVDLGVPVVSMDPFEWVGNPHVLLDLMDRYRCDYVWQPNFAFRHLIRTKQGNETYRLEHVKAFVSAGERIQGSAFDAFVAAFQDCGVHDEQLVPLYGMAETVLTTTLGIPGQRARRVAVDGQELVSCGRPVAGLEVRVSESATPVGELEVRGPTVFSHYDRNAEATEAAFVDGWYRTGDVGAIDAGEVVVVGRIKDVIVHHGSNYYAPDLETAATVPGIKAGRIAAVSTYDEEVGSERVEIIAERDPDRPIPDAELDAAVRRALEDGFDLAVAKVHLVPERWLIKTTSGKISRHDNLAKLLAAGGQSNDDQQPLSGGETFAVVRATIATTFDVPESAILPDTVARDVSGWDSLGHTVLMVRLSNALQWPIPEQVAAQARCVGDLVALIDAHRTDPQP